jgi:hypothetical protein
MSSSFQPKETPILVKGFKNNEASSTISKGMAVKLDTAADDGVKLCSATADTSVGIAMQDIAAGAWGDVMLYGVAVCLAGGTVHRLDRVGPDTASKVAAIATDKKTVLGIALREAAANELFEVLLTGPGVLLSI